MVSDAVGYSGVQGNGSLVLCQDLVGSWGAQCVSMCLTVGARVNGSRFSGSRETPMGRLSDNGRAKGKGNGDLDSTRK